MILPNFRLVSLLLALLIAIPATGPAVAQTDELQETSQLLKQRQLDRALERVDAYLKTHPKDARGRFLRGLILVEQNKPNDAIRIFTELTQEFPELPEPYNNLAVLYASQGQYDKARTALEMAIRTHPSYSTAHENLGDIYAKMASQAYDKALQLDKSNAPLQTKLNLIKDLFSNNPRPPKVSAVNPETTKVAAVTPGPAAKPAGKITEPAPKPAPTQEPAKPAHREDEVVQTVNLWAKAWSENDVAGYLHFYAADFKTPKGETRADWEGQRKARIAKPRKIQVSVGSLKVMFNDKGRVTVTFRQHYESGPLKVASTKTLVMVKTANKWLIQQERAGS